MSETHDPWKDVEAELARCREIAAEWGVSPDSVQLSLTPDSLVRLLAARAAEATQHQQEIAAKDAIIKRIQNAARVLVDGADRRSEAEVKRRVAAGLSTLDSEREMNAILTNENDALRARLAAVEAERDSARDACLEWDAICKGLRAERDRLKAAIEQVAARCRLDSKKLHAVGQMATVVEERQANDPKALKARIQVLEDQVAELEGVAVSHAAAADAAPALTAEDWHNASRFEAARAQIAAVGESLSSQVVELAERVREDLAVKTPNRIRAAVEETLAAAVDRVAFVETVRKPDGAALGGLKRGARIMLEALATAPDYRLTRQALSTRAGIKMGGTFSDYLSALRTRGHIDETHGVALTDAGLAAIGPILPAPLTRAVVLARHASRLKAGARRMFDVLAHRAHKRAELAEKAGIAMGGTFSDYLSALRTAGLIDERDGVVSWSETFRALR